MKNYKTFDKIYLVVILIVFFTFNNARSQVICIMCYDQNLPVSTGINNLVLNGSFENSNCTGGSGNFCPNSNNYQCDINSWTCTGGGIGTYAHVIQSGFSTVPNGLAAPYFGNLYCHACSTNPNDITCLATFGCTTRGNPPGYPINDISYGGLNGVKLSQTVNSLVPGNIYVLEFWCGGEGFSWPLDGMFGLNVGFGDTMLRCPPTVTGTIGRRYIVEFRATAASHTLSFTNWGHICPTCSELILDDVMLYTLAELNPIVPSCAVNPSPIVNIASSDSTFCDKQAIQFYDLSTNSPTSWHWYFPGANPSSSLVQNPNNIFYPNPGVFPVTLVACNGNGCDSVRFDAFINELAAPIPPPLFVNGDTLCTTFYPAYEWYDESDSLFVLSTDQCYVPTDTGKYFVFVTDTLGCQSASVSFIINSVSESVSNYLVSILPNPFKDRLKVTVNSNGPVEFSLYDIAGRKLYQNKFIHSLEIENKYFSKGVYFFELKNEKGIIKKGKLIRE